MSCISDYLCGYLLIMLFTIGKSDNKSLQHGPHWFYPADDSWPPTCKGKSQSPIELYDSDVKILKEPYREFEFVNYDKTISCEVSNDGHTVMISIDKDDDIYTTGGGLKGKYNLKQIHFHWPSEHKLNGNSFPLEAHFVHSINKGDHREKRADVNQNDSIHVMGVFFKTDIKENKKISKMIKAFKETYAVQSKTKIKLIPSTLMPRDMTEFYRYEGSLTTPPCYEIVNWTIFRAMVNMSQDQYDVIKQTEGFNGKYMNNNREIMPLNNRIVQFYGCFYDSGALHPATQSSKRIYAIIFVIFFNLLYASKIGSSFTRGAFYR